MKRAFNYTDRRKIPASAVAITLNESPDGEIPSFDADLSGLDNLELDPSYRIILEPYVVSTSMRFDCGLLGDPQLPQDRRLTDLDQGASIRFRILIVDEDSDPCRIMAAGKVSAGTPDEDNRRSILRLTETPSLGERLWRLDLDDDAIPELLINSRIPGFKTKLLTDPFVQGLVLPAVVRDLLKEVLTGAAPDDTAWVSAWKTYAETLAGRSAPDGEGLEDFIEDCVQAFCDQHRFADRYINLMKGKDDG